MESYSGVMLGGFLGLLIGIISTAFMIYPKMMSKFAQVGEICSRHTSEINTLFHDRDRIDAEQRELIGLIKSVVDQNSTIIEKVLRDGKKND